MPRCLGVSPLSPPTSTLWALDSATRTLNAGCDVLVDANGVTGIGEAPLIGRLLVSRSEAVDPADGSRLWLLAQPAPAGRPDASPSQVRERMMAARWGATSPSLLSPTAPALCAACAPPSPFGDCRALIGEAVFRCRHRGVRGAASSRRRRGDRPSSSREPSTVTRFRWLQNRGCTTRTKSSFARAQRALQRRPARALARRTVRTAPLTTASLFTSSTRLDLRRRWLRSIARCARCQGAQRRPRAKRVG